jgi:hypothetical protein
MCSQCFASSSAHGISHVKATVEIVYPGIEQSKTECPFCGLVWQDHTLNEVDGCMALLHVQFSAALARDAKLKGKPNPKPTAEVCPVCSKTSEEHTEADLESCRDKWRKREQGSTGLELQHLFTTAHFEGQEVDPLKRAQLQARVMQALCPCGKAFGDHTVDETLACAPRNRSR